MKLVAFAYVVLAASGASAEPLTGNDLLTLCETEGDPAQFSFCAGYVMGAIDGLKLGVSYPLLLLEKSSAEVEETGNRMLGYCLPEGVTLTQQIDIIVQRLNANPETRHAPARSLVQEALVSAFPCQ